MFKVGNIEISSNVVLAPLAGYTNRALRGIAKEMGAGLVYTEMISAKGLIYDNDKTWDYALADKNEHPLAGQIFGGEIEDMVKATILLNDSDVDIIDINMGCPVKKVIKQGAGAKLLTDPKKVYDMVKAVVDVSEKPVSVKIRAGWDHHSINCVENAIAIEKAGAQLITIHGRTKSDLYGGKVNLDWIKDTVSAVSIPVIGNGDIKSLDDAIHMLEYTKAKAIMVGRGALGNPWLLKDIATNTITKVTEKEKIAMIIEHFNRLLQIKPEKIALLEMRTLASWYAKGAINSKEFKRKLLEVKTKDEFTDLVMMLQYRD